MTEIKKKRQRERIRELVIKHCARVVAYEDRQNAIDAGFDPDECAEAHLGGDCPLCGAS